MASFSRSIATAAMLGAVGNRRGWSWSVSETDLHHLGQDGSMYTGATGQDRITEGSSPKLEGNRLGELGPE
jgi:hypothetical protein